MSKRELKKYIKSLKRSQLEDQVMDLYTRFKEVKVFYDFVFNPKEEKLLEDAKSKIYKEYFPNTKRRAKKRRSVAQKIIKHYLNIGVDAVIITEIMVFNIETAVAYTEMYVINQDTFYKSILSSFRQAVDYANQTGLAIDFNPRLVLIIQAVNDQSWINKTAFLMNENI